MGSPWDNEVEGRILGDSKRRLDPSDFNLLVTHLIRQTAVNTGTLEWLLMTLDKGKHTLDYYDDQNYFQKSTVRNNGQGK